MATAAAAAIAKARRDIQHEFFSQDAVRAERAIAFDPARHVQRRVFDRWQRAGVIREARPGHYCSTSPPTTPTCASGTTACAWCWWSSSGLSWSAS